jgi:hypothetical protein
MDRIADRAGGAYAIVNLFRQIYAVFCFLSLAAFCSPPLFIRPFGAAAEKCVRRHHTAKGRARFIISNNLMNYIAATERPAPYTHDSARRLPRPKTAGKFRVRARTVNEFDQVPRVVPAKSFRVDKFLFYEVSGRIFYS